MGTPSVFLKNIWYVAAWSHEIGADTLLARTITRVPLLFSAGPHGPVDRARGSLLSPRRPALQGASRG